jgi:hypothetical protein
MGIQSGGKIMKREEILKAFPETMSRDDIYEAAQTNYLHVHDTKISEDHYVLEVKEYFGHTDERGEPCEGASDDDFEVVFEYTSEDDETYIRQFEDLSVFPRTLGPNEVELQNIIVRENAEKQGVEVIFSDKPDESVRSDLKRHGFRWSKFQKLWYAKADDRTRAFANSLVGEDEEPPDAETIVTECYYCGRLFDTGERSVDDIGNKPECYGAECPGHSTERSHAGILEAA